MIEIEDFSLRLHNTFGINVKCKRFLEYETESELKDIVSSGVLVNSPYLHIGQGSNLLFLNDFNGNVLHSKISDIEIVSEGGNSVSVRVGAGCVWDDFVRYAVSRGYYGSENLSLIPGEVGAAAVQNIGAYGAEAKDIITAVEVIDIQNGTFEILKKQDCGYAYRFSRFKADWKDRYIVHHVVFSLQKNGSLNFNYGKIREQLEQSHLSPTLENVRVAIIKIRKDKLPDPDVLGSAGSFFMNPVTSKEKFEDLRVRYPDMPYYQMPEEKYKIPAGWLIEKCGWKGKHYKNAAVYDKQALIIVNCGKASGQDIKELSEKIQRDVEEKFGITLKPEVIFVD